MMATFSRLRGGGGDPKRENLHGEKKTKKEPHYGYGTNTELLTPLICLPALEEPYA